jgi:SAM-dependent methyltransferase
MAELQEIDVEQLMERVRENVRRRKSVQEDPTPEDGTSPFDDGPGAADLAYLHSGYDVRNVPLASPRPLIGPLVVAAKKIFRTLFAPALGAQVVYNAASTRVIAQMNEWIARLGRQQALGLRVANHRIAEFERSHAELQDTIFDDLTRLRQEVLAADSKLTQQLLAAESRLSREASLLRQEMIDAQSQLQAWLGEKLDARSQELHLLSQSSGAARERISRAERKLRRIVRALEAGQLQEWRPETAAGEQLSRPLPEPEPEFDYAGLEERFRGSEEDIKERQRVYVQHFQGRDSVLDIGCGRGEFLELLAESGIKATGVDLDLDMVLLCQEKGLDVVMDDAFHYLGTLADDSLDGVFAAQVIEHLHPRRVIELVTLCYRKLAPGGILILETPNPRCLTVFAESFYKDPSHIQPLHPDLMQFVLEATGFHGVEIKLSAPVDAYFKIPSLQAPGMDASQFNQAIERVNSILFGFQDYAVIGRKSPGARSPEADS